MKFEVIKKWLPMLVFGIPAIWLGLYVWAWMARVGCGEVRWGACLVTAFGNWGADLVMFRWFDTTLAAGLFAFLAGTFVYLAARIQRTDQVNDRNAAVRQLRLSHLEETKRLLRALAGTLRYTLLPKPGFARAHNVDPAVAQQVREYIAALTQQAAAISTFSPLLATTVGAVAERVRISVDNATALMVGPDEFTVLTSELAVAAWAAEFFNDADRLLAPDGTYRHIRAKWAGHDFKPDYVLKPLFET